MPVFRDPNIRWCDSCRKQRAPGSFRLCPQCQAAACPKPAQDTAEYPSMMEDVAIREGKEEADRITCLEAVARLASQLHALEDRVALTEAALAAGKPATIPPSGKVHTFKHKGHYFQCFDDGSIRIDTANGSLLTIGSDGFTRVVRPTKA